MASRTFLLPLLRDLIVIFQSGLDEGGVAERLGGYSFLLQRVGHFSTTQEFDADQNRVKFGVQFGYPFAFDLGGTPTRSYDRLAAAPSAVS
jgi:hypothetical protein